MKIQEIIPLTIQGEGLHSGMPCSFIRLFGCPVGCHFCDTGYANHSTPEESFLEMNLSGVLRKIKSKNVVISGGEPSVSPSISSLIDSLLSYKFNIFVETAGARWAEEFRDCWVTFSPKSHVSSFPVDPAFWKKASEIKVVIRHPSDFDFYRDDLQSAINDGIPVFLQPEWSTQSSVLDFLIEQADKIGAAISLQSHKFAGVK